jgi:hypothetical protein|nr:MAG TPA: hypothetical protein [Caudoviricetes sp.]
MSKEEARRFVWEIVRCIIDHNEQAMQMVERSVDWRDPKARRRGK